nr:NifU family protein [uncultured Porphyromonas sp.]
MDKVSRVLEEVIKPQFQVHGGDLHLLDIKGNTIRLKVTGTCQSCPSLNDTIEEIVLQSLQDALNDTTIQVEVDRGVSPSLIQEALKIIRK